MKDNLKVENSVKVMEDDFNHKKRKKPKEEASDCKKFKLKEENGQIDFYNNSTNIVTNDDLENTEITTIDGEKINGKIIRKSLSSSDGFVILQKYVKLCKESDERDLADEYLNAGGSVLEILRLLEPQDKKNYSNASTVFAAIRFTIIKVLEKHPQYQSSTEEACRHLINSHLPTIHAMLSSQSNIKHRKIVLKLLAAIVSLGGMIPNELLNNLSLHSQLLDILLCHTKPSDKESVRVCFIHFILSFLIEGNQNVIKTLLDKRGILTSIFPGLMYDYSEVVVLVFGTIKKYILENPAIYKTLKLHTFSTPVILNIVSLYNWKGPLNWQPFKKKKVASEKIDEYEKEVATEAVHEFLITLLTSDKYGIVFHDKSLGTESGIKHNQLINSVLAHLNNPWEQEKPSDLVIKILMACPDLIKSQLKFTENYIIPRISQNWISVITFIEKIISSTSIEVCLKRCSLDIATPHFATAIINLTLPMIVLRSAIIPALEGENIILHHKVICLLVQMLKKLQSFVCVIKSKQYSESDIFVFKSHILEYVVKNLPSFELIVRVWSYGFQCNVQVLHELQETISYPLKLEDHLLKILDVLELYNEICPELITDTTEEAKPEIIFTDLDQLQNVSKDSLNFMKVKALRILIFSDKSIFSPDKKIFEKTLLFLLLNIQSSNIIIDTKIYDTAKLFLNESGMFEGCSDEIDIWLHSITHFTSTENKLEIANWLCKTVKKVANNFIKYISLVHKIAENDTEMSTNFLSDQKNVLKELSEKDLKDIKLVIPMQPITTISLVLYAAIENLIVKSSKTLSNYFSLVITHCLHCQIEPQPLLSLIKNLNLPVKNYLASWEDKVNLPAPLKKPFKDDNVFSVVSKLLLTNQSEYNPSNFGSLFPNFKMSSFEVKALLRLGIFYITQCLERKINLVNSMNIYQKFIVTLLSAAKKLKEEGEESLLKDVLKIIFGNPILLHYFDAVVEGKMTDTQLITNLLKEIFSAVCTMGEQEILRQLVIPFKNKFKDQIYYALTDSSKKNDKIPELHIFDCFLSYFEFTDAEIADFVNLTLPKTKKKRIVKLISNFTVWGILISKLIDICYSNNKSLIKKNIIKKLFDILIDLKSNANKNFKDLENSLCNCLEQSSESISAIDLYTFNKLLEFEDKSDSVIKILANIIKKKKEFKKLFLEYITKKKQYHQKFLIFSVLNNSVNFPNSWNQSFINELCGIYQEDIINFIIQPKEKYLWIEENINAVIYIINAGFVSNTCISICDMILSNGDKLDIVKENSIKVICDIFKKASNLKKDMMKDLIHVLVHITLNALKKDSKNITKLNFLCTTILNILESEKSRNPKFTFEELSKNYSWPQFTRISLKMCMKISKDKKKPVTDLMKVLVALCDAAYKNNENENFPKTIFEMAISHSDFVNIMLNNSDIKEDLLHLLWTLVNKNPAVMLEKHLTLYLASYSATLSKSDQYILKLLRHYEKNGIKLDQYRPYLWGNAAALHYSFRGTADSSLLRHPSTSQILDSLDSEVVKNTITNFPVNRGFEDSSIINVISKEIYDPAFYLPVFTHLLSDNNLVECHKVTCNGALALSLIACSSCCSDIRLAAYTVISRFYFHLESTSSKGKILWQHFIDSIRNGISESEFPLKDIRLNGFLATFLARSSLIINFPLTPLYSPVHNYLIAKPAIDLDTIPELLELYHSSDVEFQAHRQWILEVIRDGLKTKDDMDIALQLFVFKMLFSFYHSSLADKVTKKLTLEIVDSATKLRKPCILLVKEYSLLTWLIIATETITKFDTQAISCLLQIANNIIYFCLNSDLEKSYHRLLLIKMLECLKTFVDRNSEPDLYQKYMETFKKASSKISDLENS